MNDQFMLRKPATGPKREPGFKVSPPVKEEAIFFENP